MREKTLAIGRQRLYLAEITKDGHFGYFGIFARTPSSAVVKLRKIYDKEYGVAVMKFRILNSPRAPRGKPNNDPEDLKAEEYLKGRQ